MQIQQHNSPLTAPDLEEAVLGAILLENDAILRLDPVLPREAFSNTARQLIYEAVLNLFQLGQPIDILTVKNQLRKTQTLQAAGNASYLTELTTRVASSANLEYHARVIMEKLIARKIEQLAISLSRKVQQPDQDVFELLDQSSQQLMQIEDTVLGRKCINWKKLLWQSLDDTQRRIEAAEKGQFTHPGIFSGLKALDQLTHGFQSGELIILAARPAMGKSSLMRQIAKQAAKEQLPVLILSPEMTAQQISDAMLIHEAEIDSEKFQNLSLTRHEMNQFENAALDLANLPMEIDDTGGISLLHLKARTNRWRLKHKQQERALLCIDYLQLLKGSPHYARSHQRHLELGEISRTLKELAKNLQMSVLALSQLSREVDKRPNPRPMLSDLRQSGNIEQDADKVIFLYRPAYYASMQGMTARDEAGNDLSNVCILTLAKHRGGATGEIKARWEGSCMRLYDWEEKKVQKEKIE